MSPDARTHPSDANPAKRGHSTVGIPSTVFEDIRVTNVKRGRRAIR